MSLNITKKYSKTLKNSLDINTQFKNLIETIDANTDLNKLNSPRGLKVKELLLTSIEIDPTMPMINFNARKFNYKYFAGELLWYINMDRKIDIIKNFSNFWDNIKNEDGTVNSNYGYLLFGKQMNWVVNSLLNDKSSRQAIAYLGGEKYQYKGNKDLICTQYIIFFIRDNKLYMKVQMRSNDVFYGLSYDAPFFATVHQTVYLNLKEKYKDLELGSYFHFSDNSHFYERHFEIADKILIEETPVADKLILKEPLFTTNNIDDDHVNFSNSAIEFITTLNNKLSIISELKSEDYKQILKIIFK